MPSVNRADADGTERRYGPSAANLESVEGGVVTVITDAEI